MALTTTSLAAAMTATQTKNISVTSTSSGFPAVGVLGSRQLIQIDGEYMLLDQVVASGVINVLMRGYNGTVAVAHDTLAPLTTSANAQDFGTVPVGAVDDRPPYTDDIVTCGQNGTIAVPIKNTTLLLTKASALATTTLGAPSKAKDGVRLTITSETAAAHVITATSLIADGVSGSPHTTLTWAAYIGASIVLESANGLWNVISAVGVTVS
jgi:hypothetical protein